jgi:hypothetical protein
MLAVTVTDPVEMTLLLASYTVQVPDDGATRAPEAHSGHESALSCPWTR